MSIQGLHPSLPIACSFPTLQFGECERGSGGWVGGMLTGRRARAAAEPRLLLLLLLPSPASPRLNRIVFISAGAFFFLMST